ncbi:hypothetical protein SRABI134_03321 [Peribacillus sp. Bi134]|jgi:hypothetical protein|nr:hypothetical protein SRABI134_03321 [Peribacillus sp. Bi134]
MERVGKPTLSCCIDHLILNPKPSAYNARMEETNE